MSNELVLRTPAPLAASQIFEQYLEEADELTNWERAASTERAYAWDWKRFCRWLEEHGYPITDPLVEPIPPKAVAAYLVAKQHDLKPVTLGRQLAAIKRMHFLLGFNSPTDDRAVVRTMQALRRKHSYDLKQATPLFLAELEAVLSVIPDDLKGVRDRAILTLGWWAALRRSEIVALVVSDLTQHPEGMQVRLRRSKTDQTAKGRTVAVHYRKNALIDAVRAVRAWQEAAEVKEGRLFRRLDRWGNVHGSLATGSVNSMVKRRIAAIGLDPDRYSAHSLRAGLVSESDRRHIPSGAVRAVTGHKSEIMLNSYQRPGELFKTSAGAYFDD